MTGIEIAVRDSLVDTYDTQYKLYVPWYQLKDKDLATLEKISTELVNKKIDPVEFVAANLDACLNKRKVTPDFLNTKQALRNYYNAITLDTDLNTSPNELLDDPDLLENIIRHMYRDQKVLDKAIALSVSADDFGNRLNGIKIYREFVNIALQVGKAPISQDICLLHVKNKINNAKLESDIDSLDTISAFVEFIYDKELSTDYILQIFPEFIKRKRTLILELHHKNNPAEFAKQYLELEDTLKSKSSNIIVLEPEKGLIRPKYVQFIPTGLTLMDKQIGGLGLQEYGLILGPSGGGKSTVATICTRQAAKLGWKALYITLEEPADRMMNRFYSSLFKISYTNLHKQLCEDRLTEAYEHASCELKEQLGRFRVADLRAQNPVSANVIRDFLDQWCDQTGFFPDVIFIDQMEYMTPNNSTKDQQQWQALEIISKEFEALSNHLICGEKPFALWLLHQINGDTKTVFNIKDIAGFKGIVRPFDIAFGVGRDKIGSPFVHLASLKTRHGPPFIVKYKENFELMNLIEIGSIAASQELLEFSEELDRPAVQTTNKPRKSLVR